VIGLAVAPAVGELVAAQAATRVVAVQSGVLPVYSGDFHSVLAQVRAGLWVRLAGELHHPDFRESDDE
jgi:hypothetical protein